MTLLQPWLLQAKDTDPALPKYTSTDWRQFLAGIWTTEGVLTGGALNVGPRASGANLSVDVAAGKCVVACDTATPGGFYYCVSTAVVNVGLPAAPPSGTRTHFIIARVRDGQNDGGTAYNWTPDVAPDTGGGATLPTSALKLAEVTVAHGQAQVVAANITDSRAYATVFGVDAPPMAGRGALSGTFAGGKTIRAVSGRFEDVAPADGKISIPNPPGATAILDVSFTPIFRDGTTQNVPRGWTPEVHTSSSLATTVVSCRQLDNNLPITSPAFAIFTYTIVYQ